MFFFSFPYFKKSACSPLNESRFFQKILSCMVSIQERVIMAFFGRKTTFEALRRWHLQKISLTCPSFPGCRYTNFLRIGMLRESEKHLFRTKQGVWSTFSFHKLEHTLTDSLYRRGPVRWLKIWEFLKLSTSSFQKIFRAEYKSQETDWRWLLLIALYRTEKVSTW